jgi:hypothetical protein
MKGYQFKIEIIKSMNSTIEKYKPLFRSETDFIERAIKSYLWLLYHKHNLSEYESRLNKEMEDLKKTEKYKKGGKQIRDSLEVCTENNLRNEMLPKEYNCVPMAHVYDRETGKRLD